MDAREKMRNAMIVVGLWAVALAGGWIVFGFV